MNDQDKAKRWHEVAVAIVLVLAAWEVFGLWGHHWLRRRTIKRVNEEVDRFINKR